MVFIIPAKHLVIKGIGGHHTFVDDSAKTLRHLIGQRGHCQFRAHRIGKERKIAAGGAHRPDSPPLQRPKNVQHFKCFHQRFQGIDPRHPDPFEKSAHQIVGAGKGRRMRHHHFLCRR